MLRRLGSGVWFAVAFTLIAVANAPAVASPLDTAVHALQTLGVSVARGGRTLVHVLDDVRTRPGIRRLPVIGKYWRPLPNAIPTLTYNALFPRYVEVCTMSQYVELVRDAEGRIVGHKEGGWGGHATMFLRGACLDRSADYPRLELCDGSPGSTPEISGVGVSVNQVFGNVNWIAFPGRELFLTGGVSRHEVLDEERFEEVVTDAARSGLFTGVELREDLQDKLLQGAARSPSALVRESVGTDFGVRLARTLYCALLPVPREVLSVIVAELNALNDRYAPSGIAYEWDLLQDNCSHALHNAIAAAAVWDRKRTRLGRFDQVTTDRGSHLAFPFNTVLRLAQAGNTRPIDSAAAAFRDPHVRATFDRFGWISTGHGSLVEVLPIHPPARNLLFIEGAMPVAGALPLDLPRPIRKLGRIPTLNKESEFRRFFSEPSYRGIRHNLERYRDRYRGILAREEQHSDSRVPRVISREERLAFRDFRERFVRYLRQRLVDVEQKLDAYEALAGDRVTEGAD